MRAVKWKALVKVCEGEGCQFDRQRGDHYIMTKPGLNRPVVIPRKNNLKEVVVLGVGKTLGLNRKQILERLDLSKSKAEEEGFEDGTPAHSVSLAELGPPHPVGCGGEFKSKSKSRRRSCSAACSRPRWGAWSSGCEPRAQDPAGR